LDNWYDNAPLTLDGQKVNAGRFGIDFLLPVARRNNPHAYVAVITGRGAGDDRQLLESAIDSGADMWFEKPASADSLCATVLLSIRNKISWHDERDREASRAEKRRADIDNRFNVSGIVGTCPQIVLIFERFASIVESESTDPIFLIGERGTGKELFANAIHKMDKKRCNCVFKTVNVAGLSENLLQSELFGHVKGAFTGATSNHVGWFKKAEGGTLFLDEIGDATLNTQKMLLRAIQFGEITPVGSTETQHVKNVRIVAATNRDLNTMVSEGEFRDDLYDRLDVFTFRLPPLRDRGSADILKLSDTFVRDFGKGQQLSKQCQAKIVRYPWPGNVRQLQNVIKRATTYSKSPIIEWKDFCIEDQWSGSGPAQEAGEKGYSVEQVAKAKTLLASLEGSPVGIPKLRNDFSKLTGQEQVPKLVLLAFLAKYGTLSRSGTPSPIDEACRNCFGCDYSALKRHLRTLFGRVEQAEKLARELF